MKEWLYKEQLVLREIRHIWEMSWICAPNFRLSGMDGEPFGEGRLHGCIWIKQINKANGRSKDLQENASANKQNQNRAAQWNATQHAGIMTGQERGYHIVLISHRKPSRGIFHTCHEYAYENLSRNNDIHTSPKRIKSCTNPCYKSVKAVANGGGLGNACSKLYTGIVKVCMVFHAPCSVRNGDDVSHPMYTLLP